MLNKMERQHITISQFLAVGEAYKAIRSDLVRYTGNAGSSEENFFCPCVRGTSLWFMRRMVLMDLSVMEEEDFLLSWCFEPSHQG